MSGPLGGKASLEELGQWRTDSGNITRLLPPDLPSLSLSCLPRGKEVSLHTSAAVMCYCPLWKTTKDKPWGTGTSSKPSLPQAVCQVFCHNNVNSTVYTVGI